MLNIIRIVSIALFLFSCGLKERAQEAELTEDQLFAQYAQEGQAVNIVVDEFDFGNSKSSSKKKATKKSISYIEGKNNKRIELPDDGTDGPKTGPISYVNRGSVKYRKSRFAVTTDLSDLKVLTVIVNFSDFKTTDFYSVSDAAGALSRLKTYYNNVTNGNVQIDYDLDNNGKADIEVIDLDIPFDNCIRSGGSLTPVKKLSAELKEYNAADYNTVVYATIPSTITKNNQDNYCGYAGIATYGGLSTNFGLVQLMGTEDLILFHEFGHNLELSHSGALVYNPDGSVVEIPYGDHTCIMGNPFELSTPPHLNPTKSLQLGKYDADPAALVEIGKDGGSYNLFALTNKISGRTKVIHVENDYYIALRSNAAQDVSLNGELTGVAVYRGNPSGGKSILVKTFRAEGDTFQLSPNYSLKLLENYVNKTANMHIEIIRHTVATAPKEEKKKKPDLTKGN